ncbi:MAG: methylated-DNA--[protein]-cysteine S-methyltransferase [Trichlorobacter sp.]|uniref:methylated-DNA--[protein]-cysteine S-methyltransferase n=1 Tax=Trichlorobacter sp. TaxID=2911007 RepID=UPI002566766A|nr:methylated-DNA--[protein]-cysteine S-methyltransferase [Trichlorobacter sp.]MDK9717480.1 methylated-DNA--[protein]-cysteine S-methyltransferase [Trichlorobacter sp.]
MSVCHVVRYVTNLGPGAVAVTEQGVCRVWLPGDDLSDIDRIATGDSELAKKAAKQLEQYFQGCLQRFDLPVDISLLTPFRQQVLQLTINIPYGSVSTYGQLAKEVGSPHAARAVGGALGANPVPVIIPCHRVVASNGALTGFSGAGGILMKENLLSLEGVDFRAFKKV